ncbi:hypothetical protein AB0F52_47350 [Amycolatopsis sp. NPDC024027]
MDTAERLATAGGLARPTTVLAVLDAGAGVIGEHQRTDFASDV